MKIRKMTLESLEARQMLTAVPQLVLDIQSGIKPSNIQELYLFKEEVYFRADDGEHGSELWKTDGTSAGTGMVKDLNPGKDSSTPGWFTEFRGELYFSAIDGNGDELWKTDGTSAGTLRVADISAGDGSSRPSILTVLGDQLMFAAITDVGNELWQSDGTAAGTKLVQDIRAGSQGSDPGFFSDLVVLTDRIYFNAETDEKGDELWRSDGTPEGTELVIDAETGEESSFPFGLFVFNDDLYFVAEQLDLTLDRVDTFLFKVDGETGAASRVADIPVDFNQGFFPYKGHLYFAGFTAENGTELYRTNGDETELFKDFFPGTKGSRPRGFHEFEGNLYFVAGDSVDPENDAVIPRLWRTNGTSALTLRVSDNEVDDSSGMLVFNHELYFSSTDNENGFELYKIGPGFADRPVLVKDIYVGDESSSPRPLTVLDDKLVLIAQADRLGYEIWTSDGTDTGTTILKDIFLGGENFTTSPTNFEFFPYGDDLLFLASSPFEGEELWVLKSESASLPVLPGDADGNGVVAFPDFLILASNFGKASDAIFEEGDFDGDGKVAFPDFLILASNFGKTLADLRTAGRITSRFQSEIPKPVRGMETESPLNTETILPAVLSAAGGEPETDWGDLALALDEVSSASFESVYAEDGSSIVD